MPTGDPIQHLNFGGYVPQPLWPYQGFPVPMQPWMLGTSTTAGTTTESPVTPAPITESGVQKGVIRECIAQKLELHENEDGLTVIRAKVQEADSINRNGRVYPRNILEREVARMNQELANRPGTVNHPEGISADMRDIGLLWTNVWMDGNDVMAEGVIIPTAAGKDLEEIIRAGVNVGISSRGFGSAKREKRGKDEVLVIQEDFELVTFDAVSDPSVFSARIKEIESFDIAQSSASDPAFIETLAAAVARAMENNMDKETTVQAEAEATSTEETLAILTTDVVTGTVTDLDPTTVVTPAAETEPVVDDNAELTVMATPQEGAEGAAADAVVEEAPATETEIEEAVEETVVETVEKGLYEAAQERIKVLETISDTALSALSALVALAKDELDDGHYWHAGSLANTAAAIKSHQDWVHDDEAAEFEAATFDKAVEGFKALVRQVSTQTVEAYIDTKVDEAKPKYAKTIAEHLKKHCASKVDVDAKFAETIELINSLHADKTPGGRGTVSDPEPRVTRQANENEQLALAGRVTRQAK
jgi:hypothetical protein